MKRKMILGERIMYINASTSLNCIFTVKIRGTVLSERLHAALAKIQQKHPLLHAAIKDSGKRIPHFVLKDNMSGIPVRMVERQGDDHWKEESKAEWGKLFSDITLPLARIVWLYEPEVSELMLVCPHCICDGKSIVTLMEELLLLLDHPEKELVPYTSFNSLKELLSESYSIGKLINVRLRSVMATWFLFSKSHAAKAVAGNAYMLHWKLNEETTSAIAVACKRTGTTVHAVLCVAFLEAFRVVKGYQARGVAVTPVDVRRFVPEIKEDMMFAVAPTVRVTADAGNMGFWIKVKQLKNQLHTEIQALKARESLLLGEYFSADRIIRYLQTAEHTHDVTLSNMGRLNIAEHYDSFEVETFYSPTVAFPWKNPTTAIVHTFRSKMDFTFCSNDAFLEQKEALAIQENIVGLLLKGAETAHAAI